MPLPCSCAMRWKIRSAPERSTRTAMPGYLASNVRAEPFGGVEFERRIERHLAFLARGLDQRRRHFRRRRRGGLQRLGEQRRRGARPSRS